jgi:hypothetical protein
MAGIVGLGPGAKAGGASLPDTQYQLPAQKVSSQEISIGKAVNRLKHNFCIVSVWVTRSAQSKSLDP